jgi:hypothetical protein
LDVLFDGFERLVINEALSVFGCPKKPSRSGAIREGSVNGLAHGVPHFRAAIRALEDEVDLGHAPVRLDVPHIHGLESDAAGTYHRRHLDLVLMSEGWHIGSPRRTK